ncbi:MAG: hypothetical protein Pg6A_06250 [Termitinemataceae bacterium]|jgi:hypothetical protein|nr:MAG: hypothetical protein Pg6A_06250 [Termitinemataceae bacterium]
MTKDEKINQLCENFSRLNDKKQDYILGITQALAFAEDAQNSVLPVIEPPEPAPPR